MAGYSTTPLAKKLGIKARDRVHVVIRFAGLRCRWDSWTSRSAPSTTRGSGSSSSCGKCSGEPVEHFPMQIDRIDYDRRLPDLRRPAVGGDQPSRSLRCCYYRGSGHANRRTGADSLGLFPGSGHEPGRSVDV